MKLIVWNNLHSATQSQMSWSIVPFPTDFLFYSPTLLTNVKGFVKLLLKSKSSYIWSVENKSIREPTLGTVNGNLCSTIDCENCLTASPLKMMGLHPCRFKIWKQKCQSYVALFCPFFYKTRKIRNARVTLKSLWSFLTRFKLNEANEKTAYYWNIYR